MNSEMQNRKWLWGGIALQLGTAYTLSFLVYQIGTLAALGTLGQGFVPGLVAVIAMISVVVYLINRTNKRMDAEYALGNKSAASA